MAVFIGSTIVASAQNVSFTSFPIPTPGSGPSSIVAGPDGALWFTEYNSSKVARITTAGAVSEFVTGITPGVCFGAIAAGPDGSLWVAMSNLPDGSGPILRFNTAGAITGSFATPEPASCAASMTPGPDGALWTGQLAW